MKIVSANTLPAFHLNQRFHSDNYCVIRIENDRTYVPISSFSYILYLENILRIWKKYSLIFDILQ